MSQNVPLFEPSATFPATDIRSQAFSSPCLLVPSRSLPSLSIRPWPIMTEKVRKTRQNTPKPAICQILVQTTRHLSQDCVRDERPARPLGLSCQTTAPRPRRQRSPIWRESSPQVSQTAASFFLPINRRLHRVRNLRDPPPAPRLALSLAWRHAVVKAMSDPRYNDDPAYRAEVEARKAAKSLCDTLRVQARTLKR